MNKVSHNNDKSCKRDGGGIDIASVLAVSALVVSAVALVGMWRGSQLVSSRPVGTVRSVSAGSSWGVQMIVETETAFYPVRSILAVEKGAPLFLQVRANGDQYLCDAAQSCAKTTTHNWKTNKTGDSQ